MNDWVWHRHRQKINGSQWSHASYDHNHQGGAEPHVHDDGVPWYGYFQRAGEQVFHTQ